MRRTGDHRSTLPNWRCATKGDLNILIVSAQFPYPTRSGFTTRVYQVARHLSERHNVTLLSYASRMSVTESLSWRPECRSEWWNVVRRRQWANVLRKP